MSSNELDTYVIELEKRCGFDRTKFIRENLDLHKLYELSLANCMICKERPREFKCGCDVEICNSCHESAHDNCIEDPLNHQIPQLIFLDGRPDNLQISDYFAKESAIIDEFNQRRLKELEERNKELEANHEQLTKKFQDLEAQYSIELKAISEERRTQELEDIHKSYQEQQEILSLKIEQLETKNKSLQEEIQKKIESIRSPKHADKSLERPRLVRQTATSTLIPKKNSRT